MKGDRYKFMKKIFIIFILFVTNSFCISNDSDLEFVSSSPKIEDLKIVKSYPFDEGQNISKVPPKPSKKPITYTQNELKYMEELRQISMEEFDKADEVKEKEESKNQNVKPDISTEPIKPEVSKTKVEIIKKSDTPINIEQSQIKEKVQVKIEPKPFNDISQYEQIIVEVDSLINIMTLKAKIDNQIKQLKTFRVSTGKIGIEKPYGDGKVTKISLNPTWYPTQDTIKSFRKKGIFLPSVVASGDKYNYMGAAKINLTHEVNGKSTFRIHGTLNEKTIGTNESAGCIRMKNSEVVQLATLMNDFAKLKGINEIKVILK